MRYITRPRKYWDSDLEEEVVSPVTIMIHEDDESYEETGLLDIRGNPLVRVYEKSKVGFRTKS